LGVKAINEGTSTGNNEFFQMEKLLKLFTSGRTTYWKSKNYNSYQIMKSNANHQQLLFLTFKSNACIQRGEVCVVGSH
jgi:hypothetical protein